MFNQIPFQTKLLLGGAVALIVIFLLLAGFIFRGSPPQQGNVVTAPTPIVVNTDFDGPAKIVSTQPTDGNVQADYTAPVTVTFDKTVSIKDVSLSLIPATEGTMTQISPQTVGFTPARNLPQNTEYSARLVKKNDRLTLMLPNNTTAASFSWTFTTDEPTGEEDFSKEDVQNFEQVMKQAKEAYQERKKQFPFITSLPVYSRHFSIEITTSDVVVITTYGTNAEETESYRSEALSWLEDNGGNPETLTIQYRTASL